MIEIEIQVLRRHGESCETIHVVGCEDGCVAGAKFADAVECLARNFHLLAIFYK